MRGNSPAWAEKIVKGGSLHDSLHRVQMRSRGGDGHHRPNSGAAPAGPTASTPSRFAFTLNDLGGLRHFVAAAAGGAALEQARGEDLVLAVDELATNSICHGGGSGSVEIWHERDQLVCEVSDAGVIQEPIHGRPLPGPDAVSGRGLWLVEQLTDSCEVRPAPAGSVVRVSMQLG